VARLTRPAVVDKGKFYEFTDVEIPTRPGAETLRPRSPCFSRHRWSSRQETTERDYAPFAAAMVYGRWPTRCASTRNLESAHKRRCGGHVPSSVHSPRRR